MIVADYSAEVDFERLEDVMAILDIRDEFGQNSFYLSFEEDYPYLVLDVNHLYVVAHYFEKEGCVYVAQAETKNADVAEYTIFRQGTIEEFDAHREFILDMHKAKLIVEDFFLYKECSKRISWYSLLK
ncbi:MAG: hypothetical protein ATN36_04900 [Epulopiscium sp. Nele67-Bin005]|nr:MAG: hypothetical protein ATN36_04900 [Epulopiscium sp. Nele67-Bin005]